MGAMPKRSSHLCCATVLVCGRVLWEDRLIQLNGFSAMFHRCACICALFPFPRIDEVLPRHPSMTGICPCFVCVEWCCFKRWNSCTHKGGVTKTCQRHKAWNPGNCSSAERSCLHTRPQQPGPSTLSILPHSKTERSFSDWQKGTSTELVAGSEEYAKE
jgi:hypothetical protein